jgi:putative ABC transport system permease protein
MSWLHRVRHRLYVLRRGERYAEEQAREVSFHLELTTMAEAAHRRGDYAAELSARRVFGNVTYYREETRRMSPLGMIDRIRQDLSYAGRGLRRSPGFTAGVVLTLALGLGVNAAMFSFLEQVFLRNPSGVVEPRSVRRLYYSIARKTEPTGRLIVDGFSYPYYRAMREADSSIALAGFSEPDSTAMSIGDARLPVRRSYVTANYFGVLGAKPQRGRFFLGDEERIEAPTLVAVISDALWRERYNRSDSVLGKPIVIRARPFTIIGVAQESFAGVDLSAVDVWVPANSWPASSRGKEPWYETFHSSFRLVARVPEAQVEQRLTTLATNVMRTVKLRGYEYDSTATVLSGPIIRALGPAKRQQEVSMSTRLAGVAVFVLLIACANAANLLLVRATRRGREFAMRRALGASRGRLYSQVLVESVLVGLLGGALALLMAYWAATALRRLLLPSVHWATGAVDPATIGFILATSIALGVIAGLAPAIRGSRRDVTNMLKSGTREYLDRRSALRASLLVLQTALSIVLLVGAGLFVRSFGNVRSIDLGYDAEHTIIVRPIFATKSPSASELAATLALLADRLRGFSGVEAAGIASSAPMLGFSFIGIALPGRDSLPALGEERGASTVAVSPGYFRATGVGLIAGRDFDSSDRRDGPRSIIVSQSTARTYWPGVNALGQCVLIGKERTCATVVGIAADVHRMSVIEKPTMQTYIPVAQAGDFLLPDELILRARASQIVAVKSLAASELRRAFPGVWTTSVKTLEQVLDDQFRPWRLAAMLFTAFGILALVVAAIGVYSVVAYGVTQRTHEIGVRIALGARTSNVIRLVLGSGLRVVVLGIALGVVASLLLGRAVASLLYGVESNDTATLATAAVLLALIALAASLIPGWRAASVDPVEALRAE